MAALFEAQITNLGKYTEGVLAEEPLSFPASPQAVQALLKEIGVDGIRYESFFITSYNFGGILPELSGCLGECESLDELNHLACLLSEMAPDDFEKFSAALSMGTHTSSLADVINLSILTQMGVGPPNGFAITGNGEMWNDFITKEPNNFSLVKSYMHLKIKLLFDPPLSSAVIESINRQISEFEWRLFVAADPV
ncbi:antirestriction protein ArdA [uncultured Alistipes sp.]|mgnify:CR=1 FL=1|uniref:antirestriction protein ArdA n=1 Tax=uncultured Alistipes sp. TaxID=538949 RepID=UPI00321F7C6A